MEYRLKFFIDEYDWWGAHMKKHVNITRRNKEEVMEGYLDTVYTWSLRRFVKPYKYNGFDMHHRAVSEKTGDLLSSNVLHELNTDYSFEFDYEPQQKDILVIGYQYRHSEIMRRPRPNILSEHLLFVFNGEKWEEDNFMMDVFEDIYNGILHITPK